MAYEFQDPSRKDDAGTMVFSIAYDQAKKRSPVRVEASREFVEDIWRVSWNDTQAVVDRMDVERIAHLKEAELRGKDNYNDIGQLRIG